MGEFVIRINILPAKSGDCIVIEFDNGQVLLIDGGYSDIYKYHLKQKLYDLKTDGHSIDLFVITHIDIDHIGGAIALIEDNKHSKSPNVIKINEVWFNTYKHLSFSKEKVNVINQRQKEEMKKISARNRYLYSEGVNGRDEISVKNGIDFEKLIGMYNYNLNYSFGGGPVIANNEDNVIQLGEVNIRLISPTISELCKLAYMWELELEKIFGDTYELSDENESVEFFNQVLLNIDEDEMFEREEIAQIHQKDLSEWHAFYKNQKDNSITNRSSIAFVIEYKGKKLLFLGDSNDTITCEAIEKIYRVDCFFDAVKLSHHASEGNNYSILDVVNSENYIVSTDGSKHDHPSRSIISKIACSDKGHKTIHFNYDLPLTLVHNNEQQKKYNFSVSSSGIINIK